MPATPNSADPAAWVADELRGLEEQGLRRRRGVGPGGADRAEVLDFGSNDYLGLRDDPRLAEAAATAAADHGWGSGASPVVSGRSAAHAALEEQLAKFEGTEAALLFPSGFAANAGVIPALVDAGDLILTDERNHASIIDGCRLARAERRVYRHGDAADVERLLGDGARFRRRLIVTDSLFSMDGDFAPLADLARLAREHGAMLMIDEAHATGVWGAGGRGAVEHFAEVDPAVERAVTVRVGTLSKALGASGGFVAGSRVLVDWIYNRARPYVFSTAPPAASAAAAGEALRIATAEPERRERCRRLADRLREMLAADGWNTGTSASQIVPVIVGDPDRAVGLSKALAEQGVYVPAIRPPSVPAGESLVRISVSARHTEDDLGRLLKALRSARAG